MVLKQAIQYIKSQIKRNYKLKQVAAVRPGIGDANAWPIEQQSKLFHLLGHNYIKNNIGVTLTNSDLMMPYKSESGMFFPTHVDVENCQICRQPNCPERKAPYDPEVMEQVTHSKY